MTASPNRRYNGHHKATEEEGDQGILGKDTWKQNVDSRVQKWWKQDQNVKTKTKTKSIRQDLDQEQNCKINSKTNEAIAKTK